MKKKKKNTKLFEEISFFWQTIGLMNIKQLQRSSTLISVMTLCQKSLLYQKISLHNMIKPKY